MELKVSKQGGSGSTRKGKNLNGLLFLSHENLLAALHPRGVFLVGPW